MPEARWKTKYSCAPPPVQMEHNGKPREIHSVCT